MSTAFWTGVAATLIVECVAYWLYGKYQDAQAEYRRATRMWT